MVDIAKDVLRHGIQLNTDGRDHLAGLELQSDQLVFIGDSLTSWSLGGVGNTSERPGQRAGLRWPFAASRNQRNAPASESNLIGKRFTAHFASAAGRTAILEAEHSWNNGSYASVFSDRTLYGLRIMQKENFYDSVQPEAGQRYPADIIDSFMALDLSQLVDIGEQSQAGARREHEQIAAGFEKLAQAHDRHPFDTTRYIFNVGGGYTITLQGVGPDGARHYLGHSRWPLTDRNQFKLTVRKTSMDSVDLRPLAELTSYRRNTLQSEAGDYRNEAVIIKYGDDRIRRGFTKLSKEDKLVLTDALEILCDMPEAALVIDGNATVLSTSPGYDPWALAVRKKPEIPVDMQPLGLLYDAR